MTNDQRYIRDTVDIINQSQFDDMTNSYECQYLMMLALQLLRNPMGYVLTDAQVNSLNQTIVSINFLKKKR